MAKIEVPISQKILYDDILLKAVNSKEHTCCDCYFYNMIGGCSKKCNSLKCCKGDRSDKKDVIYKKVK